VCFGVCASAPAQPSIVKQSAVQVSSILFDILIGHFLFAL
jgi:hypothetical protein